MIELVSEDTPRVARVRIAVVVGPDGFWRAYGEKGDTDANCVDEAMGRHDHTARVVWVEAEVPVPEAVTVQGEVAND